jgi:hypothetical protein
MSIGTALVLMAIEDSGAGHGGGGGAERKAGKDRRHRAAAGGSAESMLGWGDGSLAIFSGVAAALADIAFYQVPPRPHLFLSSLADSDVCGVCGVCGSWRGWA